jgi:hypothetical protein
MDPKRRLACRFFDLPHFFKMEIATKLGLVGTEDRDLYPKPELWTICFQRANERSILDKFWEEVEKHHDDGKPGENPFASKVPATASVGPDDPRSYEEARWFHEGFLSGATAYAGAVGHSQLKSDNEHLRNLFDAQGRRTLETCSRMPYMPPELERYAADWLRANEKTPGQVQHGTFPLGMVQRLIELAGHAERADCRTDEAVQALNRPEEDARLASELGEIVRAGNGRSRLESALCQALRAAVAAHGPITAETAPSAAKRMIGEIKAIARSLR